MSRTSRTLRTLAAGYASTILTIVLGFVLTPWIVSYLGNEGFGAFRVATDYLGYLALLDFGFSGALHATLAKTLASDDRARSISLLRCTSRYFFWLGLLTALLTLAFAAVVSKLVPTSAATSSELSIGVALFAIAGMLRPFSIFVSLAEVRQRGYVSHAATFLQSLTTSLLSLLLLIAGAGLPGMFVAVLLGNIAAILIVVRDARSLTSPANALIGPSDPEAAKELLRFNVWNVLNALLGRISLSSDTIILSLVFGSTAIVTPFAMTIRLPALLGTQLMAVGSSTWAALAELYHQGLRDRMNARLVQLTRATALLGLAGLVPVVVGNGPFVRAWMGAEQDAGRLVTLFASANAWMLSIVSLWAWIINGTGHVKSVMSMLFLGTVLNVLVSVVATIYLGPAGPLIGSAAQLFGVSSWWYPLVLHRHFGTSLRELASAVGKPLLLGAALIALLMPLGDMAWFDEQPSRAVSIILALAGMGLVALIYLALAWWLVLSTSDRDEMRYWIFRRERS